MGTSKAVARACTSLMLALLCSLPSISGVLALDAEETAASSISQAEDALVLAYEAALEVEHAEGNVSSLLVQLNVAAEDLVRAHTLYATGLFDKAAGFAGYSHRNSSHVISKASGLMRVASEETSQRLLISVVTSAVCIGVVVWLCTVGWFLFKISYRRRLLSLKPEVASSES